MGNYYITIKSLADIFLRNIVLKSMTESSAYPHNSQIQIYFVAVYNYLVTHE